MWCYREQWLGRNGDHWRGMRTLPFPIRRGLSTPPAVGLLTLKQGGGQLPFDMMQNLPLLKPMFLHRKWLVLMPPMRQKPQSSFGDTAAKG